ncbi:Fur-regulated basic protein A [Lentibacillus halodurans]|uniref:Fur-regulated basic protein A n=1 Tax=Lentibacillus halodurans TaxID=237679 RepID=A0A1I0WLE4_9BACI|nr:Fur-regulated basic protein FbpA [Lentibacillus halodurans]SFA89431.1 Fur-regulated basic protein A [Lentibacillus halodurans]
MRKHLREGVEQLREFYIQKLRDAGVFIFSDRDPYSLTLSELEHLYKFYDL